MYRVIKLGLFAISAVLVTGCTNSQDAVAEKRMDAIEKKVVLPDSTFNLKDYARFYALLPNGDILAAYDAEPDDILGMVPKIVEEVCGEQGSRESSCLEDFAKLSSAKPGDRLWINDYAILGPKFHTGCAFFRFYYQSKTGVLGEPVCAGFELVLEGDPPFL